MSDDQIRDLLKADPWLPDNSGAAVATGAGAAPGRITAPATPAAAGSNPVLPPLQLGSDVDIATCVSQVLRHGRGEVIFSEGHFWYYAGSHWRTIENHELRRVVHRYDGARPAGGRPIKLNRSRIDSILNEMSAMLMHQDFFAEAPVGINCASGFIAFASDGIPRVLAHKPDHRCRHVLSAFFQETWGRDDEALFSNSRGLGDLVGRLLDGVFLGDPDAKEKRQLLAEIAGAAALVPYERTRDR